MKSKNIEFGSVLLVLFLGLIVLGQGSKADDLITENSVGKIKLGMTITEARKVLPKGYKLAPGGGSEGVTFIGVFEGEKLLLEIGEYGERNDDGKLPPIDENKKILGISILDSRYKTAEGVHPGSTIAEVEKKYGKLKEMWNFPHDGEFGKFLKQPKNMRFTFRAKGDQRTAGIYEAVPNCAEDAYPPSCRKATRYTPGAFIDAMSIATPPPAQQIVSITDVPKKFKIQIYGPKECVEGSGETNYSLWTKIGNTTHYQGFNFKDLKPCLEKGAESEEISVAYKDQYDVNFGDYNFDGETDLALRDGMDGGYGSATYQVYLFSKATNKYVHNPLMTKLAQYQGMFQVDKKKKMLFNYSKSGCCWHQTEGYKVTNNKPVKVYEKTDDQMNGKLKVTIKKLINGKWKTIKSP